MLVIIARFSSHFNFVGRLIFNRYGYIIMRRGITPTLAIVLPLESRERQMVECMVHVCDVTQRARVIEKGRKLPFAGCIFPLKYINYAFNWQNIESEH